MLLLRHPRPGLRLPHQFRSSLIRNLSRRSWPSCQIGQLLASVDSFGSLSLSANAPPGHRFPRSPDSESQVFFFGINNPVSVNIKHAVCTPLSVSYPFRNTQYTIRSAQYPALILQTRHGKKVSRSRTTITIPTNRNQISAPIFCILLKRLTGFPTTPVSRHIHPRGCNVAFLPH